VTDLHADAKPDERPYSTEELRKLVEFALSKGNADIARACLLAVHSVEASLPELCRQAIATRPRVSLEAWRVFGPHGCMEVFLSLLSHPESRIRESAVQTLRYVGGQDALLALKYASNDPSEMVRMFARRAVRALEGPPGRLTYDTGGSIDRSVTPLGKADPIDRTIVALLLGRDVPAVQMPHVASLLSHPDDTLRHAAYEALARSNAGADALYAELARLLPGRSSSFSPPSETTARGTSCCVRSAATTMKSATHASKPCITSTWRVHWIR
jgi:hypothetical protein